MVASDVELAESPWRRIKGLLGRASRDFQAGKGLWIVPSKGIHTIGMSFPIDVIYLDCNRRVVHAYQGLLPFRAGALSVRTQSILELPVGELSRSRTSVGDLLEFSEVPDSSCAK